MGDIKRFNIYYDQMADCYCEMGESPTGTYMLAEHGQKMIDALEFYANEKNYSEEGVLRERKCVGVFAGWEDYEDIKDNGNKARQVLKEISND